MIRRTSCAHRLSWAAISVAAVACCVAPLSAQVNHDSTLTGDGRQNYPPLGVSIPLSLTYKCNIPICYTTPALLVTNSLGGAIEGTTTASSANAVIGYSNGGGTGVYGSGKYGVWGYSNDSSNNGEGVFGEGTGANTGVYAQSTYGAGLWVNGGSELNYAAVIYPAGYPGLYVNGDVDLTGTLRKSGGSFEIDHPLDPANKYLSHSFVESPDMMNVYNGNVHTDAAGNATVTLPDWFEALNRDFRYQLTTIGQPAQAWVATEILSNRFTIKTDKPSVKVSWQVTGIRRDAWANAHRIPVEEAKPENEKGFYLHPELFSQSEEKGVMWGRYPEKMRAMKERVQAAAGR